MRFFLSAIILCNLLGWSGNAWGADTPRQAIMDTQQAIDQRDMKAFELRVDTASLLDQGVKAFQSYLARQGAGALPPALALMALSANTPQAQNFLNDLLKKEVLNFIRYGIESGNFAGKPVPGVKPGGLVAPLLNEASLGRKILRDTGKPIPDGNGVRLACSLTDEGNGRSYNLDLKLRQVNGIWRIVEVLNLNWLMKKLGAEMDGQ